VVATIDFGDIRAVDIVLLKTFLEVARLRHFGQAAERLFVTQSAVSARVRLLEDAVGTELFVRKRNDLRLTAAGQRLLRHAETIVDSWSRARQELLLEPEVEAVLALGFPVDLWPVLVCDGVARVRAALPDLALQLESHVQPILGERVVAGALDVALTFEPPHASDLVLRHLATVALVLVSSEPGTTVDGVFSGEYLLVDWGSTFARAHSRAFGERPVPRLRVGHGIMAKDLLLARGGAAYLAESMVAEALAAGVLHRVADAPVLEREVFAVHRAARDDEALVRRVLGLLAGPTL
jgi:DNA-binding transcriptional LysR family regulator